MSAPFLRALARELGPMLRLALPVVVAELGWTAMATVDTLMVGRVSAATSEREAVKTTSNSTP